MRRVYASGFATSVIYVQNANDAHISTQLIPWFEEIGWPAEAMVLFGDWGNGHVPPPGPVLKTLLRGVAEVHGDWSALGSLWKAQKRPTRDLVKERTGR